MIISLRQFDKGLVLTPSPDEGPPGSLRRARGIHPITTLSLRSRNGIETLQALNAHSAFRFANSWHYGVSTIFYKGGTSKKTGLNGDRLSFCPMPPAAGLADYLFCAGGGSLFKIDSSGNVTNWGIDAPADGMTATAQTALTQTIDDMEDNGGGDTCDARWATGDLTSAEETTLIAEGSSSLKLTASSNSHESIYYDYATDVGSDLDLSQFSDGTEAGDDEFISFWLRIDKPENVDYLQLDFALDGTDFNNTYIMILTPGDVDYDITGLGTFRQFLNVEQEREWASQYTADSVHYDRKAWSKAVRKKLKETREVRENASTYVISKRAGAFHKMRIAKGLFADIRTDTGSDWSGVKVIRFTVRTNTNGAANVYIDDLKMEGGYGTYGEYKYRVTYKNTTTGNRSNANPTSVEVTGVQRQKIVLADIPTSSDSQVDAREIWRTLGDGVLFFLCHTIEDNSTTTWTDTVADLHLLDTRDDATVLDVSTELPADNDEPYSSFDDCIYWNASAFWIDRSTAGRKGRVYYSPIGRPESMSDYITVTNDDDPCQRLFVYARTPFVITETGIFQIEGTYPYSAHKVYGCPGTTKPHTLAVTPNGVAYESNDGVRLFNGMSAPILSEPVAKLFRGEAVENLTAFSGVVATYARGEYLISDTSQTLAVNVEAGTWRDVGVGCNCLAYARDSDQLAATISSVVYELEKEGIFAGPVTFEVEPSHIRLADERDELIRRVHVDADTDNQALSCYLLYDGTEKLIDSWTKTSRFRQSIPVGIYGRVVGVRLTGSFTKQAEIFGIDIETYNQGGRK